MRLVLICFSLLCVNLFCLKEANAHPVINHISPLIEVKGTAKEFFKSDLAYIEFTIVSLADNAASANKINEKEAKELFAKLKSYSVSEKELELKNYRVYEKKEYNHKTRKSELIGFEAKKYLQAKVKKLENIDSIVALLSSSSYTELDSIRYDLEDKELAKLSTYKKATRNAVKKAEAIVSELKEVKLGKIQLIKDSDTKFISPQRTLKNSPRVFAMAADANFSNESESIPQNEIEIHSEVYMSFELEDR
ncbi:MAG: SIMPL domain-containing protein [Candidatus Caenarcaniphilales bacterium]|nr:SIMPL domain-containing protein [Candidatus Caenarcaniphilales bacterium]